jgi:prepilin-type N-terminal cleavage/methylation domain-containing protein
MSRPSPFGVPTARRPPGFTFLEVLLVLGIIGLMIACVVGFFLSRNVEPLVAKPVPKPVAASTPAAEKKPAP